MSLKSGTLDDTSGFEPQFQVWSDSKQTISSVSSTGRRPEQGSAPDPAR